MKAAQIKAHGENTKAMITWKTLDNCHAEHK